MQLAQHYMVLTMPQTMLVLVAFARRPCSYPAHSRGQRDQTSPEWCQVEVPIPGVWCCTSEATQEGVIYQCGCSVCEHTVDVEHYFQ